MEDNLSSAEDLESDFDDEASDESEPGMCEGSPGMLEVPSRLSFTRSCSHYTSSEEEDTASNKLRRRRRRKKKVKKGWEVSGVTGEKGEMIEEAGKAGNRDRLSQLAVSEGGLLSDEVSKLLQ